MDVIQALSEGKRGSVARSNEVARYILQYPDEVRQLVNALAAENPAVVSHVSHACVSIFAQEPAVLRPFGAELLEALKESSQWELLHQLPKILPHLDLDAVQLTGLSDRLWHLLKNDRSSIVRTCALQALVDMAETDEKFEPRACAAMAFAFEQGSKALQARARNLLKL
ncbi:MAG: hypothetical protein COB37_07015 [Kordiimonadales bacterium]|nr:MAG: hypothetical protein COB37_07015 [Kordiimonadales bacterium]